MMLKSYKTHVPVIAVSLVSFFVVACSSETLAPADVTATAAAQVSQTATAEAAANPGEPKKTGNPSGEYRYAMSSITPVDGLPHNERVTTSPEIFVGTVTEYLFDSTVDDSTVPALATSWEVDSTGTEATIRLRENIPWQPPHGQENLDFGIMTAEDVATIMNLNNYRHNEDGRPVVGRLGNAYLGAIAVGEYEINLRLAEPVGFPFVLISGSQAGVGSLPIYLARTLETMGLDWAEANPVGTGPFVMGECIQNDRCSYHAVSEHWRAVPDIATFTTIFVDDEETSLAMVKAGQLDAAQVTLSSHKEAAEAVGSDLRFIQNLPGFIGQSILWPGNYWEEFHGETGEALEPWTLPAFEKDYPWVGDPWQQLSPENVRYTDTDNPAGMTDMEQARLVRLALSTAIDRQTILDQHFGGLGTPLYTEYMGPHYGGWDPERVSAVWSFRGDQIEASGTRQPVPWEFVDGNLAEADRLLTLAGYPLVDGERPAFGTDLLLLRDWAEIGPQGLVLFDVVVDTWSQLGIHVTQEESEYSAVIQPALRARESVLPTIKNGDIHTSSFPIDLPYPLKDSSLSRGGLNFGFETPYLASQYGKIYASPDKQFRIFQHLNTADYMTYWQLYGGLVQLPRGVIVTDRTESWFDPRNLQQGQNQEARPEFITLKR